MTKINDIFLNMLPSIDLHGYDKESARVAVNDFIIENKLLNNKEFVIIHGIGEGIIKETVQSELFKNKNVLEYKIANNNIGCTIVKLKSNSNDK